MFSCIILEITVCTWDVQKSDDDQDFEALKVTEVPSELRI